ncbi:transcriptional regulator, IclR family [Streptoalloteichus tenebrarius]|uniref:Transcriptional regulator, IclR family n=1 Tax=Streptoalloteichus tenebrarius (strain ATCC 17920 / DSM 40477 / JCM 4838 / CBS 697.72 / NBRC 16177 / NCIMB 11028 / NRRL B-12390 / A12253. 1 / ISP 5477) TaxID=1933 RepID=A0ABT1HPA7_STRSD|nr:IclR family transcriptional regulator [Streptoalloteichus tenebrarius]MCP2257346.1 transcriptional regulator, IclR family [Streptoalloteichus tenebrarius]BFF04257.1 IclR family transcriptional regulator [Streptoalloteichus tenebrarius]
MAPQRTERGSSGGVQSLERAFHLLERLADAGGEAGLSELAAASGLPLPTIHRLVRTLVTLGYVRQGSSRRYALGPRLIRLGETASRQFGAWARPLLADLVDQVGETANLAILDGDEIVYVAQAPSRHSMRMFTEVGRRVLPHGTGVGKAVLSQLPREEVVEILDRTGMPAYTPHTITDRDRLLRQLAQIARQGYALDEGEQEVGVRCVAVPLTGGPALAAVSVSGPEGRLTKAAVGRIVPLMQRTAEQLTQQFASAASA